MTYTVIEAVAEIICLVLLGVLGVMGCMSLVLWAKDRK